MARERVSRELPGGKTEEEEDGVGNADEVGSWEKQAAFSPLKAWFGYSGNCLSYWGCSSEVRARI